MRWFALGWFTTVLSLVLLLGGATLAEAKGKGYGRGGGGKHKRSRVHRSPTHHGPQRAGRPSTAARSKKFNSQTPTRHKGATTRQRSRVHRSPKHHGSQHTGRRSAGGRSKNFNSQTPSGRDGALARQRANEQRKLDHRLGQAEHLRSVAERNGNEKLLDTADRMELKAHERYEKRMAKIDGKQSDKRPPDLDNDEDFTDDERDGGDFKNDGSRFDDERGDDAEHPASRHTGQRQARRQQLRNEERKLNHRLEQADHLRSIAERNGNSRLLETADRMEEKALDHYARRLETIDRQFSPQSPRPIQQPVVDEAIDRLRSPARSYVRGLIWP